MEHTNTETHIDTRTENRTDTVTPTATDTDRGTDAHTDTSASELTRKELILALAAVPSGVPTGGHYRARLAGVRLAGLDLSGMNLEAIDFSSADLRGCDLSRCTINGSNFDGADLAGADLSHAVADGTPATFTEARMAGAKLAGFYGDGAGMQSADLTDADFTGARLRGADLGGATLLRTRFIDCQAKGVHLHVSEILHATVRGGDWSEVHTWAEERFEVEAEPAPLPLATLLRKYRWMRWPLPPNLPAGTHIRPPNHPSLPPIIINKQFCSCCPHCGKPYHDSRFLFPHLVKVHGWTGKGNNIRPPRASKQGKGVK